MKKINVMIVLVALAIGSFGQVAQQAMQKSCELSEVEHFTAKDWKDYKSTKAFGAVIWEEDFSGATLPTGWVTIDNNSLGYVWIWTNSANPGLNGQYSTNTPPFNSTTATNGYMVLPGDHYNTPIPSMPDDMDAYVQTAAINCDTAHSVMLKFEQYFRYCCGNDQIMQVSVSTNNTTWTHFDVSQGVATNYASDNPDVVLLNITPLAALQSTVYIRFYMTGVSHYYWAVDDIQLMTASQNDIKFANAYNYFYDSNWGATGSFSKIPTNQIMPNVCSADVWNYGDNVQTNVTLEAEIWNNANQLVFNQTDDTSQLSFNDTAFLSIDSLFTAPSSPNTYSVAYHCYQTQTDEIPEDNFTDTISWEITQNKIFARDRQQERWTGGVLSVNSFSGGLDGDFLGVQYFLPNTATVNSISVFIDYHTDPGTIIVGQIYENSPTSTYFPVIGTEEYEIQEADLGTWVTLPVYIINPGSEVLPGGSNYVCGVECYSGFNDLYIGSEPGDYPHLIHLETKIRLTTNWYWILDLPYIRLNLAGAVLPPVFVSAPFTEICASSAQNYPQVLEIEVSDPGNLPLTLTAIDLPTFVSSFTDNGNGTATIIAEPTPADMGSSFKFRFRADNGTVQNEQIFYALVDSFAGCIPPILPIAPDWNYTNTGNSHVILIPDTIPVTIDGIQVAAGDYIGVFYDSLGTLACAGYQQWTGQTTSVTAWGDDASTTTPDGFAPGEAFIWKIWRLSDFNEFNATATYMQPPVMLNTGFYISYGMSGLTSLQGYTMQYQNISLPQGWSYFSSYIIPVEASMDSLCAPFVSEVLIAKDGNGNTYWPLFGLNLIGDISIGQGYQVKLASAQTMIVAGQAVQPQNIPITLVQSWSLLGYLRQNPGPITAMLSSVVTQLIIVKNGDGQLYWPQWGLNDIVNMMPGKGYQIKMSSQQTFTYPAN
ncbi:MAG: hypothetical protein K9H64_11365 [Bacteroidales bacterium]|nr:hypothetical protein [Bacteroidales bacterium]MCF8456550.1 hypothetical protein [Bacteroidales bacterium]